MKGEFRLTYSSRSALAPQPDAYGRAVSFRAEPASPPSHPLPASHDARPPRYGPSGTDTLSRRSLPHSAPTSIGGAHASSPPSDLSHPPSPRRRRHLAPRAAAP